MKKVAKLSYPIVYIEWIDACSMRDSGWKCESDLEEFFREPWLIRDVGFVVKKTKDYICLVGGHNAYLEDFEFAGHRDLKIPTSCIMRMLRLKLPKKKRRISK